MIRFVLDGEQNVVPDIHRKLPGRGVWITASVECLEQAVGKNLFAKGFKSKVTVDPDLPKLVERLLEASVLDLLPLARKAGSLVSGQSKVEALVRDSDAALVVHSVASKGDGRRKLDKLTGHMIAPGDVFEMFESETLDGVTGGANTMHIALRRGGLAKRIKERLKSFANYRQSSGR